MKIKKLGRPPLCPGGGQRVDVRLTRDQVRNLRRFAREKGLPTFSAALRLVLDRSTQVKPKPMRSRRALPKAG